MANPARYADVAAIFGLDCRGVPPLAAARLAVGAIRELCADLGVPVRLRDAGVAEDALDELARRSYAADYNRWNPRHTTEADFRGLFRRAF
ncbi:iron-containing alcohol dehydrogenase family protein [Bordetella holmesii 70147]|nr:iron-containing alcohol dehydrogenase family protein [Bordetella holmesii 44057]EWM45110.1 iron-containing alcohol dehydrogenase family protein [Bordetella holmesii 70147]